MAQLERRKKYSESPHSPLSQTSPASDYLLRAEEYLATNASPSGRVCHDHEHEECPSHCPSHGKKSVLAKVKEGAKKLKYSLSGRRKHIDLHDVDHHHHHYHHIPIPNHSQSHNHNHNHEDNHNPNHSQSHNHNHEDNHNQEKHNDHNHNHEDNYNQEKHHDHVTPCWTATLEDDYLDEKDYDPEYLGAPMYESEAAPECLKETARQHPRASPVVCESHRAPNMAKQENPNTSVITNMTQIVTEKVSDKLAPACAAVSDATHQINTNTISNVTGTVSDATHQITSKLAGIAVASPKTQEKAHETSGHYEVKEINEGTGNLMRCTSGSPQTWDKGVSVKEYFLHKLEPGDDERALSQAITEAISPRKSSGDTGVVDKVKGAVSSLFWHEDASNSTPKHETDALVTSNTPRSVQMNRVSSVRIEKPAGPSLSAPATSSAPLAAQLNRVPSVHVCASEILSGNAISSPVEVYEEENHGKILQTN